MKIPIDLKDRFTCVARLAPRDHLEECAARFAFRCSRCGRLFFLFDGGDWISCPGCGMRAPWTSVKLLDRLGYDVASISGYTPGGGGDEGPPSKNPQA